jgi:hypothetical protein
LLTAWLILPLLLTVVALGCGLLLERIAGTRLPGALVLPAGLALVSVAGLFPVMSDATAELTAPLIVVLAVAGLALSPPWKRGGLDWAAVACGVGVFCVFAAPVALTGEPTISAYESQKDTATYLGLIDHFMDHGRNLHDLDIGEYQDLLQILLPEGYPLGSLLPLGVGKKLLGEDPVWLYQPYVAFVAAMLALSLYGLLARVIQARALRAAVAFVASQPALLFAFSLWAGIKELSAAWALALLGALLASVLRNGTRGRALLPLSVAAAATLGIASFAGGIWLVPLLLPALVLVFRFKRSAVALRQAAAFLALAAIVAIPSLALTSEFWKEATGADVTGESLGALVNSLSPLQVFGIWPAGDFQATPGAEGLTNVLIVLVAISVVAGFVWTVRRRQWELAVYVGGTLVAAAAVALLGSQWIDAKAFATASPAVVLMALVGALMIPTGRLRIAGAVIASVIAAGVVWSNVLAYHDVELAPRDRFLELEDIADRINGEGPTLFTENEAYASRHFLRGAHLFSGPSDVYGAVIPEADGGVRLFERTRSVDTERYRLDGLLRYRTIVRRRSAVSSRPSSAYRRVWEGRYYEVWQKRHVLPRLVTHVALGSGVQPASKPKCSQVLTVAGYAGRGGRVATVVRSPVTIVNLPGSMPLWQPKTPKGEEPLPDNLRSGTIRTTAKVPATADYSIWLTGSFDRLIELRVDGKPLAERRREFNAFPGQFYLQLGSRRLTAGSHSFELRWYDKGLLHPGTGGHASFAPGLQPRLLSFGPLALRRDSTDPPITSVPNSRARSLCGKRLDWLEPIAPTNVLP